MNDMSRFPKGKNFIGLFLGIFAGAVCAGVIEFLVPLEFAWWDNLLIASGMFIGGYLGERFLQ